MKYSKLMRLGIAAIFAIGIPNFSMARDKHKDRDRRDYKHRKHYKDRRDYRYDRRWKYRDGRRYYHPGPFFGVTIGPIFTGRRWRSTGYSLEASVQLRLRDYGYYWGPIDGIIGPESRRAIWRFQADYGLRPTGSINRSTLARLGLL